MDADILYYERANGRWESWVYGDGERHYMVKSASKSDIILWAVFKGYQPIEVSA